MGADLIGFRIRAMIALRARGAASLSGAKNERDEDGIGLRENHFGLAFTRRRQIEPSGKQIAVTIAARH
jgi:hypothetical protein